MPKLLISIINEEIKKYLNEDFVDNTLYGYHCTPCSNLESIEKNGFRIGTRNMQGDGVYAFYNLNDNSPGNAALGYGRRHIGSNFCIIKFMVTSPRLLIILDKDIAKDVLGDNADIIKQIESKYGWDDYIERILKYIRPEYHTPEFIAKHRDWLVQNFNSNNADSASKNLMFGYSNFADIAKFGVIFHGEYGITLLIKVPNLLKPLGYYNVSYDNGERKISEFIKFDSNIRALNNKLNTPEFEPLKEYIGNITDIDELIIMKNRLNDKLNQVRNNREYNDIDNLINLTDELINLYKNS